MLRRLEHIKNCGIFEAFRWDTSLPELARVNVIFGRNGTGKTCLAGALDGLRNAQDNDGFERVSVVLTESATGTRSTGFNDDSIFDRIHVFSEHYVARSHRFTPAAAEMEAVLTLGERPVDAENRLEELRELVKSKTEKRDQATKAERDARQAIETTYGQVSQKVVDAASHAGGRWHSRSNFSAGVVRKAFENPQSTWAELTEDALREKIGLINSDESEALSAAELVVGVPADFGDRLATALSATPSTVILDTLAAHPEATSWVNNGRHLHGSTDTCIFCGSGLTNERKSLIDQHFSDEVEKLQATLQGIIRELERIAASIEQALAAIPSKGLFFEDLRPRYEAAAESLRAELTALKEWVSREKRRAEAKAENVLSAVDATVEAPPTVEGAEILDLRNEHNARAESHDSLVKAAAEAVERHYLKQAEAAIKESADLAAAKAAEREAHDSELEEYSGKITTLENVDGDPMPSAKVLTEEVARLLGRSELRFEPVGDRYRVLRFGEPAVGLSAGERTAITLVHFLECVAKSDVSNGKPIVVIDDPVSSLDSDIFMGVSTYIWTEAVVKDHIEQLILLTHNFELFRQWDIQVESLHAGGKKLIELYPAQFYEIKSRHATVAGQTKRCPMITRWPPSEAARKKVRSTYHHAFISVAEALKNLAEDDSLENRLDAQLLFPNVVRRMLETFLAFKRPDWVGNFNGAMRNSAELLADAGYRGDPDALRLRLTRYAHAHSHDDDPSTDTMISPDEVATAISAVFEFMNQIDPEHFKGLCRTVGIDPGELLPEPPPEVQEDSAGLATVKPLQAG
jgi:wobble nucleotide-excising tRNase